MASGVIELNISKAVLLCFECQSQVMFQEKLEISCGLVDKRGSSYSEIMKNL
jgi:hypothetical protein